MTVLTTTAQFERVAKIVAQRVAQLLCATVFVIDQNSIAIASRTSLEPHLWKTSASLPAGVVTFFYYSEVLVIRVKSPVTQYYSDKRNCQPINLVETRNSRCARMTAFPTEATGVASLQRLTVDNLS